MNKRLNIKWVSEVINDDYKNWQKGDSVIIESQTGTGKTYFFTGDEKTEGLVDKINKNEKILYLCNRVNLKRQFKRDLLKKYGMGIPEDINELDKTKRYIIKAELTEQVNISNNKAMTVKLEEQKLFQKFIIESIKENNKPNNSLSNTMQKLLLKMFK